MIEIVATYNHSDEVSGTSVFNDGVRAYWTEGRSSYVKFRRGDHTWWESVAHGHSPYMLAMDGEHYGKVRQMTPEEEEEHWKERNDEQ